MFLAIGNVCGHARRRQALMWTPPGPDIAAAAQTGIDPHGLTAHPVEADGPR